VVKILDIFLTPYELQILGINMSVGIDGCLGKPMIWEGQGLDIFVRRSLRDVFRKVPTFSLEVKVTSNPNA
jgi:vacuolar protein sorting-associated protein 13A/C